MNPRRLNAAGLVPATRLLACKQKPREVRMNAPSRLSRSVELKLYSATVRLYSPLSVKSGQTLFKLKTRSFPTRNFALSIVSAEPADTLLLQTSQ
jgi:hypothetical protein